MERSLFIFNERSGSVDMTLVEAIRTQFEQAGRRIERSLNLADEDLPETADLAGFDLIVILSGDGSISAVADRLDGWEGVLLPLPGGTMNLLVRAIHGDGKPADIVEAFLAGEGKAFNVPVIAGDDLRAYTGIVAGQTALWGDVREGVRNRDLASLGEAVPRALSATLDGPGVRLKGQDDTFPAIYIEPSMEGLRAHGIKADGAADLVRHGIAWLAGDFRNGPSQQIALVNSLEIIGPEDRLELQVDGERDDAPAPLRLEAARSKVRFHSIRGTFSWG